jgi:hypothetical protein
MRHKSFCQPSRLFNSYINWPAFQDNLPMQGLRPPWITTQAAVLIAAQSVLPVPTAAI